MLPPDFWDMTIFEFAEQFDDGELLIRLGGECSLTASYLGVPISIKAAGYEAAMELFLEQMENIRRGARTLQPS